MATGDNGASDCSQVEHRYLYANEVGSKNLISMGKSIHTYVGLPARLFLSRGAYFVLGAHSNDRKMMGGGVGGIHLS